jgi:DNA mismatch repair protein MSH6
LESGDEEDFEDKDKGKGKGRQPVKGKKLSKTDNVVGSTSNGSSFLTAAEKRAQHKKNDKKATEDPFSFLKDVRDVRTLM